MSKNPNAPIQVRAAQPTDQTTVVAFNVALAFGTEGKTLERHILSRGVEAALADPSRFLRYWLAEVDGDVIGMAAVSREWSDWRNSWVWWLQSVYVIPEWRRKGVFRSLLIAIRTEAMKTGDVCGLRLYVEADNERAQLAYRALGLKPGGYRVYEDMWGGS